MHARVKVKRLGLLRLVESRKLLKSEVYMHIKLFIHFLGLSGGVYICKKPQNFGWLWKTRNRENGREKVSFCSRFSDLKSCFAFP